MHPCINPKLLLHFTQTHTHTQYQTMCINRQISEPPFGQKCPINVNPHAYTSRLLLCTAVMSLLDGYTHCPVQCSTSVESSQAITALMWQRGSIKRLERSHHRPSWGHFSLCLSQNITSDVMVVIHKRYLTDFKPPP